MAIDIVGTIELGPKWRELEQKYSQNKVRPFRDRFLAKTSELLERALFDEHDKMVASGRLTRFNGDMRRSIKSKRLATNRFRIGLLTDIGGTPGGDILFQNVAIYAPSVLFGWDTQKTPMGPETIVNRLALWTARRFGLNERDARKSAFGLAKKWSAGSRRQIDRNFYLKVFKGTEASGAGDGVRAALQPKYARQVNALEKEVLTDVIESLLVG